MTTLYKPVLIETTEQAEALPLWTTARIERHPRDGLPMIAMRIVRGWRNRDLVDGRIPHAEMVGWTALVPIEAEEEWTVGTVAPAWSPGTESWAREFQAQVPGRRLFKHLVTPWEEA